MPFFVYILGCADDSLYTGKTANLERRLWEHVHGIGGDYTKRRLPIKLLWSEVFPSESQAYVVERMIKGWTRAKKRALINGDFDLLHELSKSAEKRRRGQGAGIACTTSRSCLELRTPFDFARPDLDRDSLRSGCDRLLIAGKPQKNLTHPEWR
jgi:predicted GIY-YIG superfamily endonuclease